MTSPRQLGHSLLTRVIARVTILALVASLFPADARASVSASTAATDSYALPDLPPEVLVSAREVLVCVIVVVADPSGFTKTAFGELYGRTGTDPLPYAFAGEPYDSNSGFQHHRARWLDPRTGRFTAMDPFAGLQEDPSSLHKYLYAGGDPVDSIDPTGLSEFSLPSVTQVSAGIQTLAATAIPNINAAIFSVASILAPVGAVGPATLTAEFSVVSAAAAGTGITLRQLGILQRLVTLTGGLRRLALGRTFENWFGHYVLANAAKEIAGGSQEWRRGR